MLFEYYTNKISISEAYRTVEFKTAVGGEWMRLQDNEVVTIRPTKGLWLIRSTHKAERLKEWRG